MNAAEKVSAARIFDKVNIRDIAAEAGFSPVFIRFTGLCFLF
ncbi:hypothetical protein [Desulfonema ishimotonii]|nr:hypothetical protein [Desulfonema ishimotonii]